MEALTNLVENLQDVKDALLDDCDNGDIHIAKVCHRLRGFANDLVEPPEGLEHTDDGLAHLRTPPPNWVSASVDSRADDTIYESELDEASDEGSGSFDEAEEAKDTPAGKKRKIEKASAKKKAKAKAKAAPEDEVLTKACLKEQAAANKKAALIASAKKKAGKRPIVVSEPDDSDGEPLSKSNFSPKRGLKTAGVVDHLKSPKTKKGKDAFNISPKRAQEYFDEAKSRLEDEADEDEPQSKVASTRAADFIENYEQLDEVIEVDSVVEKKDDEGTKVVEKKKDGKKKKGGKPKRFPSLQEATDSCRLGSDEDHEDDEEDEDAKSGCKGDKGEDDDEDEDEKSGCNKGDKGEDAKGEDAKGEDAKGDKVHEREGEEL